MTRIVLIDNYDSFTFNLVHLVGGLGAEIEVYRNDAITTEDIAASGPDAIVLSPGPCTPDDAGICLDVIGRLGATVPTFGVCLGLQAIGQSYGGEIVRARVPMHGKLSTVRHNGKGVFRGINGSFEATRYHSLVVRRETCPEALAVTARTDDGLIMGLSHREHPAHGVQFHPESILSQHGVTILKNFLELATAWNKAKRPHLYA